jgi:hypothetical protein
MDTAGTESALELLADRARAASVRALGAIVALGILSSSAALLGTTLRWLVLPGIAITMLGLWGLLDLFIVRKILFFSRSNRLLLRGLQKTMAAIGVIAAMATFYFFFGSVLGVIVS